MSIANFSAIQPTRAATAPSQAPPSFRRLPGRLRKLAIAGLCLLQLFIANVALADKVYCVNTVAGVYDALNKALGNTETARSSWKRASISSARSSGRSRHR
jgi:hypothetical protein